MTPYHVHWLIYRGMRSGRSCIPKLMSGWNKKLFLLSLAFVVCIFVSFQRVSYIGSYRPQRINILLWYWPFRTPYSLSRDVCLDSYGISGCLLMDNRSLYSTADIVVFHNHELMTRRQKLPLHLPRPGRQRWLWLSLEAPKNNGDMKQYAGVFNLTMSYRPDADITMPYGKLVPKGQYGASGPGPIIVPGHKTDLVCWVVSNYRKHHRRTKVYQQLKNTIPVKVYGRAVKRPVPQSALLSLISRCYFYLAFENTESPHYITEKLWRNAFQAGTLPVVLGPPRRDYEAVAPPHSFIHVNDFESVDALGSFLKNLAQDAERYKSYFAWHQNSNVKLYQAISQGVGKAREKC
ncbi:hypothetical protein NFI96_004681 [Prochilodus magdalenae]|nr:hypothetical protein NFI96_004681 [Prochilodus magdalenae]